MRAALAGQGSVCPRPEPRLGAFCARLYRYPCAAPAAVAGPGRRHRAGHRASFFCSARPPPTVPGPRPPAAEGPQRRAPSPPRAAPPAGRAACGGTMTFNNRIYRGCRGRQESSKTSRDRQRNGLLFILFFFFFSPFLKPNLGENNTQPFCQQCRGGNFTFRNPEQRPSRERALVFNKQQHASGQAPSQCTAALLHLAARGTWDANSGPCIVSEP